MITTRMNSKEEIFIFNAKELGSSATNARIKERKKWKSEKRKLEPKINDDETELSRATAEEE